METKFYFMLPEFEKNYPEVYNRVQDYERTLCPNCGGVKITFHRSAELEVAGRKKANIYSAANAPLQTYIEYVRNA